MENEHVEQVETMKMTKNLCDNETMKMTKNLWGRCVTLGPQGAH